MKTRPTQDQSQAQIAYQKLYAEVRRGALRPGDRIREESLAKRFTISRTPIREAIRRLESEGIIVHRPRLGAVINQLNQSEVIELYEMRCVLERSAAELAARHASEAELDELTDLNKAILDAQDSCAAAAINQDFHQCLYWASRNRYLLQSAKLLNNALLLLGDTTLADNQRVAQVVDQHQGIIDALRAREPLNAGAAAAAHLQTSLRYRLKVMRE